MTKPDFMTKMLNDALAMVPDENGWMPIYTAPLTGTILIATLINGRWDVCEAHYVKWKDAWFAPTDYGDDEFSQPLHPSHWQPLPKPPVKP